MARFWAVRWRGGEKKNERVGGSIQSNCLVQPSAVELGPETWADKAGRSVKGLWNRAMTQATTGPVLAGPGMATALISDDPGIPYKPTPKPVWVLDIPGPARTGTVEIVLAGPGMANTTAPGPN